jgi:hypothetical protein
MENKTHNHPNKICTSLKCKSEILNEKKKKGEETREKADGVNKNQKKNIQLKE